MLQCKRSGQLLCLVIAGTRVPLSRCKRSARSHPTFREKVGLSQRNFQTAHSFAGRLFCGAGRAEVFQSSLPLLFPYWGRARGSGAPRDAGVLRSFRAPGRAFARHVETPEPARRLRVLCEGTLASRRSTAALLDPVWGRPKAFGKQPPRAPAGGCKPPAEAAPGSGFRTASGGRPSMSRDTL